MILDLESANGWIIFTAELGTAKKMIGEVGVFLQ
jgi:hypothetical protein